MAWATKFGMCYRRAASSRHQKQQLLPHQKRLRVPRRRRLKAHVLCNRLRTCIWCNAGLFNTRSAERWLAAGAGLGWPDEEPKCSGKSPVSILVPTNFFFFFLTIPKQTTVIVTPPLCPASHVVCRRSEVSQRPQSENRSMCVRPSRLPAEKGANGLNVTDFHVSLSPVDWQDTGVFRSLSWPVTFYSKFPSGFLLQTPDSVFYL